MVISTVLKGERVTLRPIEREDIVPLELLKRQNLEVELLATGFWSPRSFAEAERQHEKDSSADTADSWFVIDVGGEIIGEAGLHTKNRREGTTALGIKIYPAQSRGQGYGREALRLLLDCAFRMQNWRRVWLEVVSSNHSAIRAYLAVGFVAEGVLRRHAFYDGSYVDITVMGVLREEWTT